MEEKCPTRNPSPLCSVIIPAYNASRFIEDTVKSVIAQTFPEWECIVVDDCSTDNTFELVSAIAENEPRLRVIQNSENMRVAKTRMAGVAAARGKYVAFLDSDDMFVPEKLERQIDLLESTRSDFVCSSYELVDENAEPLGIVSCVPSKIKQDDLLSENCIGCSTVVCNKNLILRHPFNDEFFHEDYVCWLGCVKDCGCILGIEEPLVRYRFMQGTKSRNKLRSAYGVYSVYRKYCKMNLFKTAKYMLGYIKLKRRKYQSIMP